MFQGLLGLHHEVAGRLRDDLVLVTVFWLLGMTQAINEGMPKARIEEAAAQKQARIDKGEEILEAANREMMEEVGMGANTLTEINTMTLAPTFS